MAGQTAAGDKPARLVGCVVDRPLSGISALGVYLGGASRSSSTEGAGPRILLQCRRIRGRSMCSCRRSSACWSTAWFVTPRSGGSANRRKRTCSSQVRHRLMNLGRLGLAQDKVRRDRYAGIMHWCIFSSIVVLTIVTAQVAIEDDTPLHFLEGSLLPLLLVLRRPLRPDRARLASGWRSTAAISQISTASAGTSGSRITLIIVGLGLVLLTGFFVEAFRIEATELVQEPDWAKWSFVSYGHRRGTRALRLPGESDPVWPHLELVVARQSGLLVAWPDRLHPPRSPVFRAGQRVLPAYRFRRAGSRRFRTSRNARSSVSGTCRTSPGSSSSSWTLVSAAVAAPRSARPTSQASRFLRCT